MKVKKIALALLVALLILTGCSNKGGGGADEDFTFIVHLGGDPSNFHPDAKSDDYAWPVNQNVFNRLVKLTADNTFVPDLAESWEYSDDNMKLTFKLKDGVKWHDGVDFSSADVKWTYDTLVAESWSKSDTFANVESIDTPDDNTVVFNMKNPDAAFISKVSWYGTFIMPKHIYENLPADDNTANMNPVGTGPFKFDSYQAGVSVTLKRNDDFFGEKPEIDTLIFSIVPDLSTAYQAFINGEIDYMSSLPTAEINSLDGNNDYDLITILGINRSYVTFNFENEDLKKPEVRRAIAHAVDQQSIFDRVGGVGAKAETLISPVFKDYVDTNIKLPETDPAKTAEILEAAGYTKNSNGYYLEFTLDVFESGNFKDIATIIKANLEAAGIGVTINMMEMSAWQTKVMDDKNFQLTMLAGYQGPDVSGVDGRVKSTGSTNLAGYVNADLDAALQNGVMVSSVEDRKPFYLEAQKIMAEDLPIVQLLDNGTKTAIKKQFTGVPQQETERAASNEFTYVKCVK